MRPEPIAVLLGGTFAAALVAATPGAPGRSRSGRRHLVRVDDPVVGPGRSRRTGHLHRHQRRKHPARLRGRRARNRKGDRPDPARSERHADADARARHLRDLLPGRPGLAQEARHGDAPEGSRRWAGHGTAARSAGADTERAWPSTAAGQVDPGDRRRARHPDPARAVPVSRTAPGRSSSRSARSTRRWRRRSRTGPTRTTWRRSRARSAFSAWDKGAVRDSVDGTAEFTTQDGARWKVVLDRVQTKDVPHHPKFGGVILGLYYHGATGVHTPLVPTINSAVALWSIAHLYRNGERVSDSAYVHVMLLSHTRRASRLRPGVLGLLQEHDRRAAAPDHPGSRAAEVRRPGRLPVRQLGAIECPFAGELRAWSSCSRSDPDLGSDYLHRARPLGGPTFSGRAS